MPVYDIVLTNYYSIYITNVYMHCYFLFQLPGNCFEFEFEFTKPYMYYSANFVDLGGKGGNISAALLQPFQIIFGKVNILLSVSEDLANKIASHVT